MKERDFIEEIRRQHQYVGKHLVKGIGDDCAVFSSSPDLSWLISTDTLAEGIHFSLQWHDPYLLGRKTIAVNLSDIAAMGGTPRFVLVSVAIPPHLNDSWIDRWHGGVAAMLTEHNCLLIGGDTTSGPSLFINVTILGTAETGKIVYRHGAMVDDDIYVTGPLGSAVAGLELMKRGIRDSGRFMTLYQAHLDPQPQVAKGRALANSGLITAMQDISDGLATDLSHICRESGIGAILYQENLPCLEELEEACRALQLDKNSAILQGGEDYQLVFTSNKRNRKAIAKITDPGYVPFFRVGCMRAAPGVILTDTSGRQTDITYTGFEHIS